MLLSCFFHASYIFISFLISAKKLDDLLFENIPGSIQHFLQDFLLRKSNAAETLTLFTSFHIVQEI